MDKHFLVTIGDDPGIFYGVGFISHFFDAKDRVRVTLFHIAPQPPAVWPEELSYETKKALEDSAGRLEDKGRNALAAARESLLGKGFTPRRIEEKFIFGAFPRAGHLIMEGEYGDYDAVVLGQRGFAGLSAFLDRGVGVEIMRESFDFPLWVCRFPDYARSGVLVCVDGSNAALRAVDHVGAMLAGEKRHALTLFHVSGQALPDAADAVFARAREVLAARGVSPERVAARQVASDHVARAVLAEAESGRYAVVAAGRTGAGRGKSPLGGLSRAFFGSASDVLFHELAGAVLWVCR
ncbi:MAG: universal stress protein [Desulfovibrionaceae bacterium]|nr:universal stress protein [Desulfovibrionaceae bacterium]